MIPTFIAQVKSNSTVCRVMSIDYEKGQVHVFPIKNNCSFGQWLAISDVTFSPTNVVEILQHYLLSETDSPGFRKNLKSLEEMVILAKMRL